MEGSQAQQMPVRNAQDLYLIGTIADEISAFVISILALLNNQRVTPLNGSLAV